MHCFPLLQYVLLQVRHTSGNVVLVRPKNLFVRCQEHIVLGKPRNGLSSSACRRIRGRLQSMSSAGRRINLFDVRNSLSSPSQGMNYRPRHAEELGIVCNQRPRQAEECIIVLGKPKNWDISINVFGKPKNYALMAARPFHICLTLSVNDPQFGPLPFALHSQHVRQCFDCRHSCVKCLIVFGPPKNSCKVGANISAQAILRCLPCSHQKHM